MKLTHFFFFFVDVETSAEILILILVFFLFVDPFLPASLQASHYGPVKHEPPGALSCSASLCPSAFIKHPLYAR